VPISVPSSFKSPKAFLWVLILNILLYRVGGVLSFPEIKGEALQDYSMMTLMNKNRLEILNI